MPNAFFRAKEVWDGGDPNRGFAMLEEHLEQEVGDVAFSPAPRIFFDGAFDRLELAVFAMLDSPDMVQAPLGKIYASIWRMHPHSIWIALLRQHTFEDPLGFEEFADLDLPPLDFTFDALAGALAESARRGLLAPEDEGPNNGRPVLRIADIEAVPDEQWGELKPLLLEALREAYAACPADFWDRLAKDDAAGVVMRFLHDLFLEFRPPLDLVDARWGAIEQHQKTYATAVRAALQRYLASGVSTEDLTEVVRIDAGFLFDDGRVWLHLLEDGLRHSDLRRLPGRRWPQRAAA